MLGMAGSANVQGEDQKKLDVLANDVFISLLTVRRFAPPASPRAYHAHANMYTFMQIASCACCANAASLQTPRLSRPICCSGPTSARC